jgi:hypothetical protein
MIRSPFVLLACVLGVACVAPAGKTAVPRGAVPYRSCTLTERAQKQNSHGNMDCSSCDSITQYSICEIDG